MNACVFHPDRPAHAVCMSCGKPMCAFCATTWDGINYCNACLAERRRAAGGARSWWSAVPLGLLAVALLWAVTRLLVWSAVNTAELWR